jgi:hypothetical protein
MSKEFAVHAASAARIVYWETHTKLLRRRRRGAVYGSGPPAAVRARRRALMVLKI